MSVIYLAGKENENNVMMRVSSRFVLMLLPIHTDISFSEYIDKNCQIQSFLHENSMLKYDI